MNPNETVAIAAPPMRSDGGFDYQNTGTRVVLAPNAVDDLAALVSPLGCERLMVICGPNTRRSLLFARVLRSLGARVAMILDQVPQHSSTTLVTEAARKARAASVDGLVAVGGGSASDTAKGVAILLGEGGVIEEHASSFTPPDQFTPKPLPSPKLPIIAVPTTASAAEVTPGLGIKDPQGRKLLFWDKTLACRLIVLDPAAAVEVPVGIMAATAMNGFAHCAEGLYSRLRNPISEALALQGINLFSSWLPKMVAEPDNVDARSGVLTAAHLSGMVISNSRVGIHHAICHCLGARGGLSHGIANSVMLPHCLQYNIPVARPQIERIGAAMDAGRDGTSPASSAEQAVAAVRQLQIAAKVPTRLRDTGLDRALLPAIAQDTLGDRGLYFNPRRTASADAVLQLLEEAW
jgi:alcohol dehydrogenase class IV